MFVCNVTVFRKRKLTGSVVWRSWQGSWPILAEDQERRRINQKLRRSPRTHRSGRAVASSIRAGQQLRRLPVGKPKAKSINQFPSTWMHAALVCVCPPSPSLSPFLLPATNRTRTRGHDDESSRDGLRRRSSSERGVKRGQGGREGGIRRVKRARETREKYEEQIAKQIGTASDGLKGEIDV